MKKPPKHLWVVMNDDGYIFGVNRLKSSAVDYAKRVRHGGFECAINKYTLTSWR